MTSPPSDVPRARQVWPSTVLLDEPDAAVAEQDVHPAGVVAPRRDGRERRPAVFSRRPLRSRSSLAVAGP